MPHTQQHRGIEKPHSPKRTQPFRAQRQPIGGTLYRTYALLTLTEVAREPLEGIDAPAPRTSVHRLAPEVDGFP